MSKKMLVLMSLLVFLFLTPTTVHARIIANNTDVYTSSGAFNVNYITVDLADPQLEIKPVIANDLVGSVESLASMASRSGALAAINGTFFNSYSDMQPQGTLQQAGVYQHLSGGATLGITAGNKAFIQRLALEVEGGINGSWQYPNNWYAWGINHIIDDPQAIEIFTPAFAGAVQAPSATVIVVENDRVTNITSGQVNVPANGYVIGCGPSAGDISGRFKVGDRVAYRVISKDENGTTVKDIVKSISAAPLLLANGEIAVDFNKEGITDPKLTTNSGARSFVGLNYENQLVLGTVSQATILQLAEVTQALGLVSAMNLDGGASSGLYFDGNYLTAPGRNLSNSLAVIYHETPVVKVNVNGTIIPSTAYIVPPGITMVPVRGVLEKMGATVQWNQNNQSVRVMLGSNNVELCVGSNAAVVNGVNKTMQYAAEITNDRTYIPLRFVSESLGAQVAWDESTYTVQISSGQNTSVKIENAEDIMTQADSAKASGKVTAAIELYKKVITADPNMTDAYTKLANLYFEQEDYLSAADYLESARLLNPGDTGILTTLAWAYYCAYKYDDSIGNFQELLNINPASAEANYGMGLCYAAWSVKDYANARIYLQKAINLDPNGSTGQNARNILASLP